MYSRKATDTRYLGFRNISNAVSHNHLSHKQVTVKHKWMSTQVGVNWTQRIFSKSTLSTLLDVSRRILQKYLCSTSLIFLLNNLDDRTENFLTKPTDREGQEALKDRARLSMNLANYNLGK